MKTATLNLRVEADIKAQAETVLSQLGISMSTAIEIYLRQIAFTNSIPFVLSLPNHNDTLE